MLPQSARAQECVCVAGSSEACPKQQEQVREAVKKSKLDQADRLKVIAALRFWEAEVLRRPTARGFDYLGTAQYLLGDYVGATGSFQKALADRPGDECPVGQRKSAAVGNLADAAEKRIRVRIEVTPREAVLKTALLQLEEPAACHTEGSCELGYEPGVDEPALGQYVLNPGPQRLVLLADGYRPLSHVFSGPCGRMEGSICVIADLQLERLPSSPKPEAAPVAPKAQEPIDTSPAKPHQGPNPWVLVGAGLAGGAGMAFGALNSAQALHKRSQLQAMCPGDVCASDGEVQRYHDLRTAASADRRDAIIGWSVGSAAIVAGGFYAVWQLTRGSSKEPVRSSRLHVRAIAQPSLTYLSLESAW